MVALGIQFDVLKQFHLFNTQCFLEDCSRWNEVLEQSEKNIFVM